MQIWKTTPLRICICVVLGLVIGNYARDQLVGFWLLRNLKASLEQAQHPLGVPVIGAVVPAKRDPLYVWQTIRDDTQAFVPGHAVAYGPYTAAFATAATWRVEFTSDAPINVGFLPYSWESTLIKEPDRIEPSLQSESAQCVQRAILHRVVACSLDFSNGDLSLFIRDARTPPTAGSVVTAALIRKFTGATTADNMSSGKVRMQWQVYTCVQKCEQQ